MNYLTEKISFLKNDVFIFHLNILQSLLINLQILQSAEKSQ